MIALVLTVPAVEVELASDALWALGVVAVEERDPDPSVDDHFVELWTSLGDDIEVVTRAAEGFPSRWRWRLVEVDERVADSWRAHAVPTWVEHDLVVCPAWVPFDGAPGVTVLRIEPGATFGLGDHPTTVLSMRALRRSMRPEAAVLDVGCGTGVLAIAAARFGAGRVDAIDISPVSLTVATENARRNDVAGIVSVSTEPLAHVEGPYDIVVANILAPTLVELAGDLRRVVAPDGVLIVSGLLAEHHEHVEAALAPMRRIGRDVREGWVALTLRW